MSYHIKKSLMSPFLFIAVLSIAMISVNHAFGQTSSSTDVSGKVHTSYKTSYQKVNADLHNSLTVETNHHLYKPGENVVIQGDISSQLSAAVSGANVLTIQAMDNNGNVVSNQTSQANSDGSYSSSFTLSGDAKQGAYTVTSILNVRTDLLGAFSADWKAQLQGSARFVVVSPTTFSVKAQGDGGQEKDFAVNIASNSTVSNLQFDQSAKQVSFNVDGQTGTQGVTQVTIPKGMLSGDMQLMIDGSAAADNDVMVSSDTQAETTFEINYHHSSHVITISGTNVVPEFPMTTALVMAGAIGSVVIFATRARFLHRMN